MSKARDLADLAKNANDRLDTVATSDGALSNRNMVINGSMILAQRGTSFTGVTSTTNYFVDRFQLVATDEGTWSLTQENDAPSGSGFIKSAKLEITTADSSIAAGDYAQFRYKFENRDVKHLLKGTSNAKKCTLSFWVKSSIAQDYSLRLRETNSSTTRQNVKQFTVSAADTWQKETMIFDGDTGGDDFSGAADASGNFILEWLLGGGTDFQGGTPDAGWEDIDSTAFDATDTFLTTVNSTFYITGVQLEVGDTATPFEHRSYGDELARCKRYYEEIGRSDVAFERFGVGWTGTGSSSFFVQFDVEKRANPSVSISDVGHFYTYTYEGNKTATSASQVDLTPRGYNQNFAGITANNGDGALMIRDGSDAARIYVDAEL